MRVGDVEVKPRSNHLGQRGEAWYHPRTEPALHFLAARRRALHFSNSTYTNTTHNLEPATSPCLSLKVHLDVLVAAGA
jgi:hypothetical protein